MTRGRSAPLQAADLAAHKGSAYLIELAFDSGTLRLALAQWNVIVGADTYLATGAALELRALSESADGVEGFEVALSRLDSGIFALMDAEPYNGRIARILLQRFDHADAAVSTAQVMQIGRMKRMASSEEKGGKHTVAVACEHFDAEFEREQVLRFTDAEQRRRYPADLGGEYLAQLQDRVIARKPRT